MGDYNNSMFYLLRSCLTAFQHGYTILQSHQQCMKFLVSPHPCQHLLLSVCFILAILVGVKYLILLQFFELNKGT